MNHQANRCLLSAGVVLNGHAVDSIRFTHQTRLTERPLRSGSAIVIRQDELFSSLRQRCRDLGVVVHEETRATSPIIERGFLRGAACDESGCEAPPGHWDDSPCVQDTVGVGLQNFSGHRRKVSRIGRARVAQRF